MLEKVSESYKRAYIEYVRWINSILFDDSIPSNTW